VFYRCIFFIYLRNFILPLVTSPQVWSNLFFTSLQTHSTILIVFARWRQPHKNDRVSARPSRSDTPPGVADAPLYFSAVVSFSSFLSSPNLSGRRLDVYHTSTRGVALVRIYNADLKCAARDSLNIQDAKKSPKIRHLGSIAQLCRAVSSQPRHVSTMGKNNLLNSNISPICPHNIGELRPISG